MSADDLVWAQHGRSGTRHCVTHVLSMNAIAVQLGGSCRSSPSASERQIARLLAGSKSAEALPASPSLHLH